MALTNDELKNLCLTLRKKYNDILIEPTLDDNIKIINNKIIVSTGGIYHKKTLDIKQLYNEILKVNYILPANISKDVRLYSVLDCDKIVCRFENKSDVPFRNAFIRSVNFPKMATVYFLYLFETKHVIDPMDFSKLYALLYCSVVKDDEILDISNCYKDNVKYEQVYSNLGKKLRFLNSETLINNRLLKFKSHILFSLPLNQFTTESLFYKTINAYASFSRQFAEMLCVCMGTHDLEYNLFLDVNSNIDYRINGTICQSCLESFSSKQMKKRKDRHKSYTKALEVVAKLDGCGTELVLPDCDDFNNFLDNNPEIFDTDVQKIIKYVYKKKEK